MTNPCAVNSPIKLMFYLWNNTAHSLAICGHVKKRPYHTDTGGDRVRLLWEP